MRKESQRQNRIGLVQSQLPDIQNKMQKNALLRGLINFKSKL